LSYKFTKKAGMLFTFGENQAEVGFRGFINKDDAIAIAKHFGIVEYCDKCGELNEVDPCPCNCNNSDDDMLPQWNEEKGEIVDGFGTIYDIVETNTMTPVEIGKVYQSLESPNVSFVKRIPQSETDYLNSTKANKERLEESIKQLEQGKTVETTYNSEIGEIQTNELFNKESDSHG